MKESKGCSDVHFAFSFDDKVEFQAAVAQLLKYCRHGEAKQLFRTLVRPGNVCLHFEFALFACLFFSLGPRTGCCGRVCFTFPPPSLEVDLARAGDQQGGMDCTPYAKGSECTAVGCAGQAERPCTTRGKPSKLDRGLTSWQCHNSAVELNTTNVYTYYIILYYIMLYYIEL